MAQLKGVDISKWQGANAVDKVLSTNPEIDFFIIKASEGKTYVDKCLQANVDACKKHNKLIGLYHYARPDNNVPEKEVEHFLKTCLATGLKIGEFVPCLDYEAQAHQYGQNWALLFCMKFYGITGVMPVFYTSQSQLKNYSRLAENNVGLWVARWGKNMGDISPWKFAAIWQYKGGSGGGVDEDVFFGNEEQWIKYATPHDKTVKPDFNCTAGCPDCTCKCRG